MKSNLLGKRLVSGVVLAISLLFSGILYGLPSFWDDLPDEELASKIMNAMTDKEMLGQVFFLGYLGTTPSEHVMRWIGEGHIGGVKLFPRNVQELTYVADGIYEMQEKALNGRFGIPLLIATDQEGGWVQHVRKGSSESPGNMAIGAGEKPYDAFQTGYYLGMELRALGINMNFAPTVDVYSHPSAVVIGPRSFSSDPELTGIMALAYFQGMKKAGVICTAKHYPGHGGADRDSHGYLPEVSATFETLWERDLLPYRLLIKEDLPAIMGGHLAFPKIMSAKIPSTLSSFFLQEVLREKLKFQGVVVTDDLEMYGVHQGEMDLPTVSRRALMAGNDMILLSHTPSLQDDTWDELSRTFSRDRAFRTRVEEAVRRILLLKLQHLKNSFPLLPDVAAVSDRVPHPDAEAFFFDSACRAITLVRDEAFPYSPPEDEKILLVGQLDAFFSEGRRRFPWADSYSYPYYPLEWSRGEDRLRVPDVADDYDAVIFCLINQNSLEVLQELEGYEGRLYVLSLLSPVYLQEVPWVKSAVAVYGMGSDSLRAGFSVVCGDYQAEGKLPISEFMNSIDFSE